MSINEKTKKEIVSIAEKLNRTPQSDRDFVAGVLVGMERAEQAAAERAASSRGR